MRHLPFKKWSSYRGSAENLKTLPDFHNADLRKGFRRNPPSRNEEIEIRIVVSSESFLIILE